MMSPASDDDEDDDEDDDDDDEWHASSDSRRAAAAAAALAAAAAAAALAAAAAAAAAAGSSSRQAADWFEECEGRGVRGSSMIQMLAPVRKPSVITFLLGFFFDAGIPGSMLLAWLAWSFQRVQS